MFQVAKQFVERGFRRFLSRETRRVAWLKRVVLEENAAKLRSTYEQEIAEFQRKQQCLAKRLFPDSRVSRGPFAGLIYPNLASAGSALLPKLAGTYEDELQDIIYQIIATPYDVVIDVGSAEGYYAVGLARTKPSVPIFAYDSDARARLLCEEMILANDVSNCSVRSTFSLLELANCPPYSRGLLIVDCEGFERALFSPTSNDSPFVGLDIIIELHDFLDHGISEMVSGRLNSTHDLRFIHSRSPFAKARDSAPTYDLPFEDRLLIVNEERPGPMEWIWAVSKA